VDLSTCDINLVDKSTLQGTKMNKKIITIGLLSLALLLGCSDKEKSKSVTEGSMKCGAGKCGANAANGSALLLKKKMNILDQMKKDDTRRDCVLKAKTTKILYNCVRNKITGRLSTKCDISKVQTVKENVKK
jgi:hypothetical protein